MIRRLKKLWQFLRYFMGAKKIWQSPRQCDLLIYDAAGQELLLEYAAPWRPEVLHVRGEQINLPVLVASLFRRGKQFDAYVDCFIERVRPRLIVTFIDNSPGFYSLATKHPTVKSMFIQNGTRGPEVFEGLDRARTAGDALKVDFMLTFGHRVGMEYARYIQGAVVPIGSLINNGVPRSAPKRPGTLAFISQYRDIKGLAWSGKYRTREEFFELADQLVLSFLLKYANSHGKDFFIVPCTGHSGNAGLQKKEQAYYDRLLGQRCAYADWRWRGSSYDAVDSAEVAVCIDSTLGYESAARGNKTAIFSFRSEILGTDDRTYGWPEMYPDAGPYWTNRPEAAEFERILNHLFAITDEQWQSELAEHGYSRITAYDPGNTILRSVLQNELGSVQIPLNAATSATCIQ